MLAGPEAPQKQDSTAGGTAEKESAMGRSVRKVRGISPPPAVLTEL